MSWQTILLYFFIILLIFYFMTCAGYLVFHRYFIMFPSRKLTAVPSDFQLQYEDVYFSTVDKVLLNGWFISGDPGGKWREFTIILFLGNKGTMSDFLPQVKQLTKTGFNAFLFGYGVLEKALKNGLLNMVYTETVRRPVNIFLKKEISPSKK